MTKGTCAKVCPEYPSGVYIYIYIYTYTHTCRYIHIYIYIYTHDRERERESEKRVMSSTTVIACTLQMQHDAEWIVHVREADSKRHTVCGSIVYTCAWPNACVNQHTADRQHHAWVCIEQLPNHRHRILKAFEERTQNHVAVCFITEWVNPTSD